MSPKIINLIMINWKLIAAVAAVLTILILLLIKHYKKKYIKKAFIRINFHNEKHIYDLKTKREVIKKEFNYFKIRNALYLTKFNPSLTEHDILEQSQLVKELFNQEVISVERTKLRTFKITLANWNMKMKPNKNMVLLAHNGAKELLAHEKEDLSYFIFAKPRKGKTYYVQNNLIKQYQRIYPKNELIVISSKKEDWTDCFSYENEDLFIKKLQDIDEERKILDTERKKFDRKIIIVCDEIQNLCKESSKYITKAVREWASQGVVVILATQSGKSSDLNHLPINLMATKISILETESQSFAQTIFPEPTAKNSFFNRIEQGYGYISNSNYIGKVKFYYEI
jgi:hypothetical protein